MTIGVDFGEVSGFEPVAGIGGNGPGRSIAGSHHADRPARRLHEELAPRRRTIVDADLDTGHRRPHGADLRDSRICQRDHRPCLGEPIALDERHTTRREELSRPVAERRPPGDADPHLAAEGRGKVGEAPGCCRPLQPLEERRHAENHGRRCGEAGIEHAATLANHVEAAPTNKRRAEVTGERERVAQRQP